VLKLSSQDALLVTLLVAVTNFIWNPVGGALSTAWPQAVLLRSPPFVRDRLSALLWPPPPDFGKMLAVELISRLFRRLQRHMLGALVEIVPKHVRTTCSRWPLALAAPVRYLHRRLRHFADRHDGDRASPVLADVRRASASSRNRHLPHRSNRGARRSGRAQQA